MPYTISNNPKILYIDSITGIYKDIDGTWYLNNGTPIDDYDPNTGAYQEGGNWYTFQGVELLTYDKATGNYQEPDGVWYDKNGTDLSTKVVDPKKALTKTKPNSTLLIVAGVALVISIGVYLFVRKK